MLNITVLETGFTVGEVAGLISGCIAILHTILPMVFAIVLIALIKNGQHDAATWSAIGHQLQSSFWPVLIFWASDPAVGNWTIWKGRTVRWRVSSISSFISLGAISLLVAGFLTPRPLAETIRPSVHAYPVSFRYAPDYSFYGQGTLPRPANPLRRVCGWSKYYDCPHSIYDDAEARNQYFNHTVVNSTIPNETREPFRPHLSRATVATPIDIEYRNWYENSNKYVDNGAIDSMGYFRPLQTFALDDGYRLIEGLIVDAIHGGIGFRNHTIPMGLALGGQWSEDILWLQPETACTSVNLTLHFSISESNFWTSNNGSLTDEGGFSKLTTDIPLPRWDNDDSHWRDVGPNPNLQERADIAAWWNNQFTAQIMNVSSSETGSVWTNQLQKYASLASPSSVTISSMDGKYLDSVWYGNDSNIGTKFKAYGVRCSGYDDEDPSNSTKAFVRCGYLYGVPRPLNEAQGQSWRYDLGSKWTQQLYTCASAVKASVKIVTFASNGTESLDALSIVDVKPRNYIDEDPPLWGIEKVEGYNITDINLFWGLIDESYANSPDIESRKAPEIYLPANTRGITFGHIYDSFAAGLAPAAAWESVYEYSAAVSGVAIDFIPSYSGETNYGLTLKWRELSQSPQGAAKILNLIWTDIAAFGLAGTSTGFEDREQQDIVSSSTAVLGKRAVNRHVRVIEYENILYAIPAMLAGGLFLIGFLAAAFLLLFQIVPFGMLIHYINHTSIGRAITWAKYPQSARSDADSSEWLDTAGKMKLDIPGYGTMGRISGTTPLLQKTSYSSTSSFSAASIELNTHRMQSGPSYTSIPTMSPEEDMSGWPGHSPFVQSINTNQNYAAMPSYATARDRRASNRPPLPPRFS